MSWHPGNNNPGHGRFSSPTGGVPRPIPTIPFHEEFVSRHDQIQRIAASNTLVLEDILGLREELASMENEVHTLINQTIPRIHADNELECRAIIQRGLELEEEVHAIEPIKEEVLRLTSEKMELLALREELSEKVRSCYRELEQIESENKQIPAIRAEFHELQEELLRARRAYEYEKQAKVELVEERRTMERDFLHMKIQADKLRAELEKRGRRPGVFKPYAFDY
ncbi:hypothetical protein ACP70R_026760 [Stipagrostis hirtigluma subsp. patula]